jgi:hypothetical protein
VTFVAIILCVASQRVFIVVVYFVIDSVRKLLDTPSYLLLRLENIIYRESVYRKLLKTIRYTFCMFNVASCLLLHIEPHRCSEHGASYKHSFDLLTFYECYSKHFFRHDAYSTKYKARGLLRRGKAPVT